MKLTTINRIFAVSWRGLAIGCVFLLSQMIAGMILGMLGLIKPGTAANSGSIVWMFLAAVLIGITLGMIAHRISASRPVHALIWSSIIYLNLGSVMLEGVYFAPEQVQISVGVLAIQQLIVSILTGLAITLLFTPKKETIIHSQNLTDRQFPDWIWRFIVSAFSYLLFYFVFGSINYALVTRPYYETHAGGLSVPEPTVVLLVELIRAPLIILSVVPFLKFLQADTKNTILLTELILFVIGGVAPLLFQAATLPAILLLASAVEIFLQNFLTGVVTAVLMGTPLVKETS